MPGEGSFEQKLEAAVEAAGNAISDTDDSQSQQATGQQQAAAQQTQQAAQQAQQATTQDKPWEYEYKRGDRSVKLSKEQIDEVLNGVVETWESEYAKVQSQQGKPPTGQQPEGQQQQDPLISAFEARIAQLEQARNDDLLRREREEIERLFSNHEVFKSFDDRQQSDALKGFLAFLHSRRPGEPLESIAKLVSSIFEHRDKKTIDGYVKGKLKAASKPPEGAGGGVAVTSPKKLTGEDFKKGKLAKVAEDYLDSLEAAG